MMFNTAFANIRGWPPDKPKQKLLALELAAAANLVIKNDRKTLGRL